MASQDLTRRVIVVDDSGVFGFTLSLEFRNNGWNVYCCGNAEDALKQLEDNDYDLILSDVFMPGMRGDEMAELILRRRPDSRIILMSSMPKERLPALPRGVAFLPKPVSVPMILKAFEKSTRPTFETPPPPPSKT